MYHLNAAPVALLERGPQRLVPGDESGQGSAEGPDVQRAAQPQRGGRDVLGTARLELGEEPQPLLRERQRKAVPPGQRGNRRRRSHLLGFERRRERGDGRGGEQCPR